MALPHYLDPADVPKPAAPYQVLAEDGAIKRKLKSRPADEELLRAYRLMRFLRVLDSQMLNAQRQGRISFYGTCTGQEAAVIGSALALGEGDLCVPALREGGAALLRGYSFRAYVDQVFGNDRDLSRGRQMPCHYGSRAVGQLSLSSPVANQLPQAVGMAYAEKMKKTDRVVMSYMGDGGTAAADFHYALNFSAVWKAPVVFICQNNQWAISTPWEKQMATQTIAERAEAYAVPHHRVDGNDLLAVHEICARAVARARKGEGPTFVELVTYRVGAHSTSDDPSRYRDEDVTQVWAEQRDPLIRLSAYLQSEGLLGADDNAKMDVAFLASVKKAMTEAGERAYPPVSSLFTGVYADLPPHLARQRDDMVGEATQDDGPLDPESVAQAPWEISL